MAVNINGDTGIDKVQPGSVDGVDLSDGSVSSPKLDTNIAVTGTLSAGGTVTAPAFSGDGSSLTGIAGGFSNMEVFTSPGTWTNPGNVQKVKVTVVGGGGGGGGCANGYPGWGAGGGGGGGTAIEVIPFPSATNVPVTIGNGGSARPFVNGNAGSNGVSGGTSSFGAYCSASGGTGGRGVDQPTGYGLGGSGSGGTLNITGGRGELKWAPGENGQGGDSTHGFGGMSDRNSASFLVLPGNGYGGGGAGGMYAPTPTIRTSAVGTAGVVIVEY